MGHFAPAPVGVPMHGQPHGYVQPHTVHHGHAKFKKSKHYKPKKFKGSKGFKVCFVVVTGHCGVCACADFPPGQEVQGRQDEVSGLRQLVFHGLTICFAQGTYRGLVCLVFDFTSWGR